MPKDFQSTLLTLFLKKSSQTSWIDFRPISLYNVSNKVLTKLLALRLASLLPHVTFHSQSVFVLNRVIHNNVLLVSKLVYDLSHRTRRNNLVLKLDMAKAYD